MQTRIIRVSVNAVQVGPRLRALRPEKVAEIAASMRGPFGQEQPIGIVYPNGPAKPQLVYGWHRLEAAKQLRWPTLDAVVLSITDPNAIKLAEIDENLMRADLSPAERAQHLLEKKRIHELLHPQTKHGGDRSSSRQNGDLPLRFTTATAAITQQSQRTVQRELARAERIPRIGEVPGTSLDEKSELDALAKLPEKKQNELIDRAKAGVQVTAIKEPPPRNPGVPKNSGYKRALFGFYVEPRWFVDQILEVESFDGRVHDPCCGIGTIPSRCLARGIRATGSDIISRSVI
jgi:ParB-like chromosome segregation protein Spo0J